jgi:hypothetical protein
LFLKSGEKTVIDNPRLAEAMASYFPGLGTGRKSYWELSMAKDLELTFYQSGGRTITAYTKGYRYWGSDVDQGDLAIKGDLKSYLEALFTSVKVQEAASTKPKG